MERGISEAEGKSEQTQPRGKGGRRGVPVPLPRRRGPAAPLSSQGTLGGPSPGARGPAACGDTVYVVSKVAEKTREIVLVNLQTSGRDQAGALCLRRNKMRGMKCSH